MSAWQAGSLVYLVNTGTSWSMVYGQHPQSSAYHPAESQYTAIIRDSWI